MQSAKNADFFQKIFKKGDTQKWKKEGEIYECVSSYSVFAVVYHLEGTYNLTAELNPVPKEIFSSFYK